MNAKLAQALLAFQKDAPTLRRDSTNPHFENSYLSLESLVETVRPALNKHGLIFVQSPMIHETFPALRTAIIHAETGEMLSDVMPLGMDKPGPQAQGSALTYARRYSLMAMLGLVADEDDDGHSATAASQTTSGASSGQPKLNPETFVWQSGKHQGQKLDETPGSYIDWYAENGPKQDVREMCRAYSAEVAAEIDEANVAMAGMTPDDDIPFAPTIDGLGN